MSCKGPESACENVLIKEHNYSMMVSDLLREAARYISEHSGELVQDVKYLGDVKVIIEIPCDITVPTVKVESEMMSLEPEKIIEIKDAYKKSERKGDL